MAVTLALKLAALAAQEARPDAWDAHLLALLVGREQATPHRAVGRPPADTEDCEPTRLIDRPRQQHQR
jgi:hypothetical protein